MKGLQTGQLWVWRESCERREGQRSCRPLALGVFLDSDKTACVLCILLLTATCLGSCICDVTTRDGDHSRTEIV